MATKLKNLKITSVDLVEQGANPDAHIKLYKSKDGRGAMGAEKNSLLDRLLQRLAAMVADYLDEKEKQNQEKPTSPRETGEENKERAAEPEKEISPKEKTANEPAEKEGEDKREEMVSLDYSRLTAREKQFLRGLAEKYGSKKPEDKQVAKAKAELQQVEKQIQRAKTMAIAKEYAILGKSADSLCNTLLELETKSPQGYAALLDALEEEKLLIEKSGVFSEIGKSGEKGGSADGWGKIVQAADRLQKENPSLTRASAIQKACLEYPQLVADYEENL